MLIRIQNDNIQIPFELEETTTLSELYSKVQERTNNSSFILVYAEKELKKTNETLFQLEFQESSIIHLVQPKSYKFILEFKGSKKTLSFPLRDDIVVSDIKREVRNVFPDVDSFSRTLPDLFQNGITLSNNILINTLSQNDVISVVDVSEVSERKVDSRNTKDDSSYEKMITMEDENSSNRFINNNNNNNKINSDFVSYSQNFNKVEIVFCFDTTGSMAPCIKQFKTKIIESVDRLLKHIPNLRIGIIAHGDYCDQRSYVVKTCPLTSCSKTLHDFVSTVRSTGGGDPPEAYEYGLQVARKRFEWRSDDATKALIMIGDEVPHPPSYTTKRINWFDELDLLAAKGIKVYGVRALTSDHSIPFYEEMADRTGAISIHINNFQYIVDMFLAICYRESCSAHFQQFMKELEKEGKMNGELQSIMTDLSKPNKVKVAYTYVIDDSDLKTGDKEEEDAEDDDELNQKVRKEKTMIRVRKMRTNAEWFNFANDFGSPKFTYDRTTKTWFPSFAFANNNNDNNNNNTPILTPTPPSNSISIPTTYTPPSYIPPIDISKNKLHKPKLFTNNTSVKLVVVGDEGVGKTSMLITYTTNSFPSEYVPCFFDNNSYKRITFRDGFIELCLWDTAGHNGENKDHLRPLSYPQTDVFLICFSMIHRTSFDNRRRWVAELQLHCPGVPYVYVGTKSDLLSNGDVLTRLKECNMSPLSENEVKIAAKEDDAAAFVICSSLTQDCLTSVFNRAVDTVFIPSPSVSSRSRSSLFSSLKKRFF